MKSSPQQQQQQQVSRPKRRATNAHIFRYLQTRNPTKLEENDLKRALEASLEECPDFWPEDSASCSSSEQSNAASSSSSSGGSLLNHLLQPSSSTNPKRRNNKSMHHNHLRHSNTLTANSNCCPSSTNRYKPVARKNIYNEADFFHDGIMQYIEYELSLARSREAAACTNKRARQAVTSNSINELNE